MDLVVARVKLVYKGLYLLQFDSFVTVTLVNT